MLPAPRINPYVQLSRIRLPPRVRTYHRSAMVRMRPAPVSRAIWPCVQSVLCWHTFPLASALRSTNSAADRSALFAGFTATMASSDFPRPCIIGYGSSPSRCGPGACANRPDVGPPSFRRDLSARDALFDPGGAAVPRITLLAVQLMWRSAVETASAPAIRTFRGSITHPTQQLCTLRGRRYRQLTQHSTPGGVLGLTWAGLAPTDRASLPGAFLNPSYELLYQPEHSRQKCRGKCVPPERVGNEVARK